MRGEFTIYPGTKKELVIPNFITDTGELSFLKMLMRDDQGLVAGGGNWYFGLCGNTVVNETATLPDVTDEVAAANGYVRQPVPRSLAGWPTTEQVNSVYRIVSAVFTFTASGGDYDKAFTRLFLTDVASGLTPGFLFALSRPLLVPFLLIDGQNYPATYSIYLGD